jgi:CheY-like chemotaxis protein
MKTLLIVDDNAHITQSLKHWLDVYHLGPERIQTHICQTLAEAERLSATQPIDGLLSDVHMTDRCLDVVQAIRAHQNQVRVALMTAYQVEDCLRLAQEADVYTVLTKNIPFDFHEFSRAVNTLLFPETAFGLAQYLAPGTALEHWTLKSSQDIMTVFQQLNQHFLQAMPQQAPDLATALIEALTNAVYHAPRLPNGDRKYQKGQTIQVLEPNEVVTVQFGKDSQHLAMSIMDQWGQIQARDIVYWIDRHISGSGLLDTHGRGLFLLYTLADRLFINIHPNQQTEIILQANLLGGINTNHSLNINQVP